MSDIHVDDDVLTTLRDVMEDEYPALLEAYLVDAEERLSVLRETLARADAEGMRQAAHSFKGSCGNLGVARLAEFCQQLERVARAGELELGQHLLAQMELEFVLVRGLFEAELKRFIA
ncbi:Hpt domain-containing protein [Ectopseudomonas mendocina]|uniref:Hpt domain-containing protein n=1 Tax=Ectopseudomonas mendocina TaxID=300 RepID=A0ABZ2RDU2_ECTME